MQNFNSTKHLFILDIVRAISSLLVCANHLRSAVFTDFSDLNQPGVFDKIFYFATSLGHQSVIVFFVISGFLIGGSIIKSRTKFEAQPYALSRLTRLYTVLIPALLFTIAIDLYLAKVYPGALGQYYQQWNSGPTISSYSNSFVTFLGNFLFLQNIFVSTFGTNSPLWSLSYELWYYVTFPLFLIPALKLKNISLKTAPKSVVAPILLLMVALGIVILLPFDAQIGFLIWIIGAVLIYSEKLSFSKLFQASTFGLFVGSLLSLKLAPVKQLNPHVQDLIITATFTLFLVGNLNAALIPIQKAKIFLKSINVLSNVSFTLYLFHFPLVVLLACAIVGPKPMDPSLKSYIIYFFMLGLILIVTYMAWFIFERNTYKIKKMLSNYLIK